MFENLFMPKITTLKEAIDAYNKFSDAKHCYKRKFVLQKWDELCFPTIQEIIQDKDIVTFFRKLNSSDLPPEGKSRKAMEAATEQFISIIPTPQQAKDCYNFFSAYQNGYYGNKGSVAEKIFEKWNELVLPEIENANSIPEIKIALEKAPYNKDPFIKGILKWVEACQTVDEIEELTKYVMNKSSAYNSIASSANDTIHKRKTSLLLAESTKATDIEKIKHYYHLAPSKSAVKIFIFERWLNLCTTPEEANEAFMNAPEGRVACQLGAYKKVRDLVLTKHT